MGWGEERVENMTKVRVQSGDWLWDIQSGDGVWWLRPVWQME